MRREGLAELSALPLARLDLSVNNCGAVVDSDFTLRVRRLQFVVGVVLVV